MMQCLHIGKAGEYRVMSELLLLGWVPSMPSIDIGKDIVLNTGISLQVKTVSKPVGRFYTAQFGNSKYHQEKIADFIVIWCIEENCFYIIPSKDVKGRQTIAVPSPKITIIKSCQYRQFLERWDLLGESPLIGKKQCLDYKDRLI